jgi:hypothetical protein
MDYSFLPMLVRYSIPISSTDSFLAGHSRNAGQLMGIQPFNLWHFVYQVHSGTLSVETSHKNGPDRSFTVEAIRPLIVCAVP